MITFSSLLNLLSTAVLPLSLALISIFLMLFVAIPLARIRSYKQDGVSTYFFPLLGFFNFAQQHLQRTGDMMTGLRAASQVHPNPKFLASHVMKTPFLILQGPQYIKEFLQNQNNYIKVFFTDVLIPLLGRGLVSAEGETWKRHRKIVSASFNFEFIKEKMPLVQKTTREFFDKLTADDYKSYSAISRIQDITGEIVGRIFFGENLNSYTFEGKPLTIALADLTSELGSTSIDPLVIIFGPNAIYAPVPRYRRILKRVKEFRKICFDIINDRKSKPNSQTDDLLSSLLATQKSQDVEGRLSDEEIVDEFVTFFVAGMDTTGHLIGMTFYNLVKHPEYLSKLQAERDATYNKEQQITTDTLSKMEVLHSIFKETLRLHTPAPTIFMRKALQDHNILDIKVKKGDLLTAAFITPASDEKNFKNSNEFNPGRWANLEGKIDPYAFTPFSVGPRNCIGQHLAIMEAKVIISEFLERFEFNLKDKDYQLKMLFRFLYEPLDDLLFTLKPKLT